MKREELLRYLQSLLDAHPDLSDVNFTVGRPAQVEVHGKLQNAELGAKSTPLTPEHTSALSLCFIDGNETLARDLDQEGSCDCAIGLPSGQRFRVNIFRCRGSQSIVMRALPNQIPDLATLKVPAILNDAPKLLNGLVLVTGATGSGKSTTLAAIVNEINATRPVHVVTLEDPVEFAHPHQLSTINQREKGLDFHEFSDGLRAALRQAPKVILVGEMRDRETIEIALKAAETGHLVLSTLHTIDAGQTINRLVAAFEVAEQKQVRGRLAQTLRFVIGQRLLPRQPQGRVAALEIMGSNLRIRELILNDESGDRTFQQAIADAKPYGWQTFDQHIVELYEQELVTEEVAKAYCTDAAIVGLAIDRIRSARGEETSDITDLQMDRSHQLKGLYQ